KESSLACAIAIAGFFPWFKGLRWGDEAAGAAKSGDELPGLLPSAPKPLGRGSTGRTVPENLKEQMAMTAVRNNPAGSPVTRIKMGDSRWPGSDGWVKMQQIEGDVNIHYVYNTLTGSVDDFKFVSR
ncbi:hypothetical protein ACFVJS_26920, partial [Nocardioides sp. NPDC057772]|uniref:hypothetical protein n=1 Tax=Nocardioides sp. NPDC057772 TaxID=3346245 RepID=UPI0036727B88